MKTMKMILMGAAVITIGTFTSCKKDYTCTCTTAIGAVSGDVHHDIDNSSWPDAKRSCQNYEDEANRSVPGSTSCRL